MPNNFIERLNKIEEGLENLTIDIEKTKDNLSRVETRRIIPEISKPVFIDNINGLFQTVSVIPTHTPRNFKEQIVLVDSGSITKMYIRFGNSWRLQRFYNT